MTTTEWLRLEAWFAEAAALTGSACADFVRQCHAEDPALARELDGLLAAQGEAAVAFAEPIVPQLGGRAFARGRLGIERDHRRRRPRRGAARATRRGDRRGEVRPRRLRLRCVPRPVS